MNSIDFLPDIYRERRKSRYTRLWGVAVLALFSLVIGTTATAQWCLKQSVLTQLANVQPQFAGALARDAELAQLQKQYADAEELAGLYLYLKHPWPRTQILATALGPLPASIRFQELRITDEAPAGESTLVAEIRLPSTDGGTPPALSNARQDLQGLREQCDGKRTTMSIIGMAASNEDLHAYVAALGQSPLVAEAQLKGLEAETEAGRTGHSRFTLHLVLRPGYGQSGGPQAAETTHSATTDAKHHPAQTQLASGRNTP